MKKAQPEFIVLSCRKEAEKKEDDVLRGRLIVFMCIYCAYGEDKASNNNKTSPKTCLMALIVGASLSDGNMRIQKVIHV